MGKEKFLILISCHLWKLISAKIVNGDICNTYIQWRTCICMCICVCVCVCVCVYEYTYIHTPISISLYLKSLPIFLPFCSPKFCLYVNAILLCDHFWSSFIQYSTIKHSLRTELFPFPRTLYKAFLLCYMYSYLLN